MKSPAPWSQQPRFEFPGVCGWTGWDRSETSLYRYKSQPVIWGWRGRLWAGVLSPSPAPRCSCRSDPEAAPYCCVCCQQSCSGPSFSRAKSSVHTVNKISYWSGYCKLSWWLRGKESACQCRRHRFDPLVRKIPWRKEWLSTPVFLPGKFHGQRSLVATAWGRRRVGYNLTTKQQQLDILLG